ncbi:MAG: hypothetical protein EOO05_00025 [Chitinophagaceae bacterium]|nr:MAG: hypothetical protein EOO05_00025 [Chitinophagaceae bacterium]
MEKQDKTEPSSKTSDETRESIRNGRNAIEAEKQASGDKPAKQAEGEGKTENDQSAPSDKEAKDAKNWRNEG